MNTVPWIYPSPSAQEREFLLPEQAPDQPEFKIRFVLDTAFGQPVFLGQVAEVFVRDTAGNLRKVAELDFRQQVSPEFSASGNYLVKTHEGFHPLGVGIFGLPPPRTDTSS